MMIGWTGRIVLPVWLMADHAFGDFLQFRAWDGECFRAAYAGDVHANAMAVEIDHWSAHGLSIAHDRVLDHTGKSTAAFGKIAAHLIIGICGDIEEFGFGREADIGIGCFSFAAEGDADSVAGFVSIECRGKVINFFKRHVIDGDDQVACHEACPMGSAAGRDFFNFEAR